MRCISRCSIALTTMLTLAQTSLGQNGHADIQFWYEGGRIAIQTANGLSVGTGEFATSGFIQQYETNPGFVSESDVGLGIGSGDVVVYNVLDDLQYWDGTTFGPAGDGVQILVENNLGPDTVIDGLSGAQPGSTESPFANYIDDARADGDFHGHLEFFLEPLEGPSPPFGAYGLMLSLSTSATDMDDSDPFFIVFNFGLSSSAFGTAVDAFGASLEGPALPGDFDGDGLVNLADYTVWRDNLGADETTGVLSNNGDGGFVSTTDYQLWKTHFGSGSPIQIEAAAAAVPEPTALCMTTIGAVGVLCFRWHRNRS